MQTSQGAIPLRLRKYSPKEFLDCIGIEREDKEYIHCGRISEGGRLADASRQTRYEQMLLPHLDAAYNLARWLTHDEHDAEDLVQEAYLRALRFFDGFHGDNGKVWLLTIVRNTCYSWLRRNR